MKCAAVLSVIVFVLIAGEANAFGREGHQVMSQLALNMLSPSARQVVEHYLRTMTLPGSASFPDEYGRTSQGRWSAPLHYVNLPRNAVEYKSEYCPTAGCVVSAIHNYTKQLQAEGPRGQECTFGFGDLPCPLVFLTHFLGDLHQPLHAGYEDDLGGNKVDVNFMGKKGNLHSTWDTYIIEKYNSNWQSLASELQTLIQKNPDLISKYAAVTDPNHWATESFLIVKTDVYNWDPLSPVQLQNDNTTSQVVYLNEAYYQHNLPIILHRLIAAGIRLGALLNTLFP